MTPVTPGTVPKKSRPQPKGGSRKGIPNKVATELKTMVLEALAEAGGVAYLKAKARTHPNAFLALVGKVLPLQVTGDASAPIIVKIVRMTDA